MNKEKSITFQEVYEEIKEILKEGYIDELKLSVAQVALKLGVSRKTIYDIINAFN